MKQDTQSTFDFCNEMSNGLLEKYKNKYAEVVELLNKTKAVDKNVDTITYTQNLDETKDALEEVVIMFDQLTEDDKFCYLTDECKEKFYELAGQIYAMYASNIVQPKSGDKALEYYQKYQVFLQRYKLHEYVRNLSEISVFSFRPVSIYSIADLANETITVSRPSRMNDPFDSLANLWRKTKNLKIITKEKGHEEIFAKSMDYFRIRSFVLPKEAENSVLKNIRMWSAYADEHKGFCVKYKLNEGFIKRIDTKNVIVRRLAPVKYVCDYPMPTSLTAIDSYEAYNMKHECWKYENEIRLLSYNTSTDNDFYPEPMGNDAEIEEVIFGLLCNKEHIETICNILKDKKVNFFKMTTDPENDIYTLKKEKYNPQKLPQGLVTDTKI